MYNKQNFFYDLKGNILCYEDVLECIRQTGCEGVMVAGSFKKHKTTPDFSNQI
jgi:hypothetical protein